MPARPIIKLTLWVVSAVLVALAWVLRPMVAVRIGSLAAHRLGHLAANPELYLRRRAMGSGRKREIVFLVCPPAANKQLLTMIRRRIPVLQNYQALRLYQGLRKRTPASQLWIRLSFMTNEYNEFNKVGPQLRFSSLEEKKGKELLTRMGVQDGSAFVTFHARDKAYLDTVHAYQTREKWSYQDFRDCDVLNYLPAAEYLASCGITAIRIGHIVEARLPPRNERIIDYASDYRTDFGDIYLCARCKFHLGCAGGPQSLPWIFNVPMAYANGIPLVLKSLRKADLFIQKKLWRIEQKRWVTFREAIDSGLENLHSTHQYSQAGIEVVENTVDEILSLAKEMNARLDGTWITTEEDEYLQQRYRDLFQPGHPSFGFPSRMGTQFLRENRDLLD